jgi:hypothetical protein
MMISGKDLKKQRGGEFNSKRGREKKTQRKSPGLGNVAKSQSVEMGCHTRGRKQSKARQVDLH